MPVGPALLSAARGLRSTATEGFKSLGKGGTYMSALTGFTPSAIKKAPFRAGAPAALFGIPFAYHLGKPVKEAYQRYQGGMEYNLQNIIAQQQLDERSNAFQLQAKYQRLQRDMAKASARLAAVDPQLYNEVMAGRSLPKGAVVLGGAPRTDLMEELAMGMSQGQYNQQPSEQDQLSSLLGM